MAVWLLRTEVAVWAKPQRPGVFRVSGAKLSSRRLGMGDWTPDSKRHVRVTWCVSFPIKQLRCSAFWPRRWQVSWTEFLSPCGRITCQHRLCQGSLEGRAGFRAGSAPPAVAAGREGGGVSGRSALHVSRSHHIPLACPRLSFFRSSLLTSPALQHLPLPARHSFHSNRGVISRS